MTLMRGIRSRPGRERKLPLEIRRFLPNRAIPLVVVTSIRRPQGKAKMRKCLAGIVMSPVGCGPCRHGAEFAGRVTSLPI